MSARALITGTLYGDPQARTSQAGKSFTTAAGLSVVCDELATLKAKPRPRAEPTPAPVVAGFDDDLPDWG